MGTIFNGFFDLKDSNTAILKQAILEYRAEGKRLMKELGRKFGLDIHKEEDYIRLVSRSESSIPRKGELSKRWNYSFHGGECRFYNKKHQQTVEVVLTNPPEFGHLDAWFLMLYIESTEKYKDQFAGINYQNLKPLLDKLYKMGEIENI
jgi:hypothetical protein